MFTFFFLKSSQTKFGTLHTAHAVHTNEPHPGIFSSFWLRAGWGLCAEELAARQGCALVITLLICGASNAWLAVQVGARGRRFAAERNICCARRRASSCVFVGHFVIQRGEVENKFIHILLPLRRFDVMIVHSGRLCLPAASVVLSRKTNSAIWGADWSTRQALWVSRRLIILCLRSRLQSLGSWGTFWIIHARRHLCFICMQAKRISRQNKNDPSRLTPDSVRLIGFQ